MRKIENYHVPALLKETISYLNVQPAGKYIDATLGGGGHSLEILRLGGRLLAFDVDEEAISHSGSLLKEEYLRLKETNEAVYEPIIVRDNFANMLKTASQNNFTQIDGILFDLGVSSHQLQADYRGFSFNQDGLLDMRMDSRLTVRASDLINGLSEKEMSFLFEKLGEEKFSKRYARAICKAREVEKITSCDQLSEIIIRNAPARGQFDRTHPATRVFQALRIAVNDELVSLKEALLQVVELLKKTGRLVVLSFHSLEDKIVKEFYMENQNKGILKVITDKPITPTDEEIEINPRARSAKLRAAEKV